MRLLTAIAAAIAIGPSAVAATLGLNFCDTWEKPRVAGQTADGFSGWVDSRPAGNSNNPAVQTTPLPLGASGVSATWTAATTWSAGEESNSEQALYRVYLDDGQTSAGVGVRVTLTGLAAWLAANNHTGYRLRCYVNNDAANTFQAITVRNGATTTSPVLQTITPVAKGNGLFPTGGTPGTGQSRGYGDSPADLTADTITLTIPPKADFTRGTLCAIKITGVSLPLTAATLEATAVNDIGATLHASVTANGASATVAFEYGKTPAYGSTVAATPETVAGPDARPVFATLTGLDPATTYYFRVKATTTAGTVNGTSRTFTTLPVPRLSGLAVSAGTLSPRFAPAVQSYTATVPPAITSIAVTPTVEGPGLSVTVDGAAVASGAASPGIPLAPGANTVVIEVAAADRVTRTSYVLTVTRVSEVFEFRSPTDAVARAESFPAEGMSLGLSLGFAPVPGTDLTVVEMTGSEAMDGQFANLPHGAVVNLTYEGVVYPFVVNAYGGTGNDLVLHWAGGRLVSWGFNSSGQLGDGGTGTRQEPVAVDTGGALAGKTVLAVSCGLHHALALCADGTLAAWGSNFSGQLGDGTTTQSPVPVTVLPAGALAGKTVAAIAAGGSHSLALCTDGTLVHWGAGVGPVPALVPLTGALAGKRPTAIAQGRNHRLVLFADGTLAAWGSNAQGQLGNGTKTDSATPMVVFTSGDAMRGKTVGAIGGGTEHSAALCSDGSLFAWGNNYWFQLGLGPDVPPNFMSSAPYPVPVVKGALAGRTPGTLSVGGTHNLVLCADGALAGWGGSTFGQLGHGATGNSNSPVLVDASGVLDGRTVVQLVSGGLHSLARLADGTLGAWGSDQVGQLGNPESTAIAKTPGWVRRGVLEPWETFGRVAAGYEFNVALAASPPPPGVRGLAVSAVQAGSATLHGEVNGLGVPTTVEFEYGPTMDYGSTAVAAPSPVTGASLIPVAAAITNLVPGTLYHFRIVASNACGTTRSADMTFTANAPPAFAGFTAATPWQTAAAIPVRKILARATSPDGHPLAVAAVADTSAQAGSVTLDAEAVRYTPPAGFSGADSFEITIADGFGGTVTGTVTVHVGPAPAEGGSPNANPPALTVLPGGKMGISFQGIPGRSYTVQRSTGGLDNWVTLTTLVADASGGIFFTDDNPPPGSAFYRLGLPVP